MNEKVLVVPRKELFASGIFQGVSTQDNAKILGIVEAKSFFMDRKPAEEDPSHKQIIPYAVITTGSEIFTVTRLSTQGEARLHQKVSIGLGGHINPPDVHSGQKPWEAGLNRELTEEVTLTGKWKASLVGVLNDDQTPVGSVHFGLIYRVELLSGKLMIREQDKMTGDFSPPSKVALSYDRMETWSQLVFSAFWPEAVHLEPVEDF